MFAEQPDVEILDTLIIPIDVISRIISSDEKVYTLCFNVTGDAFGYYLVIILEKHIDSIIGMISGAKPETISEGEKISMLKEFGNLLCTSNFNNLVKYSSVKLAPSSPLFVKELMGDVINFVTVGAKPWSGEYVIGTIMRMKTAGFQGECILFMVPSKKLVELLLK
jgi:chemotaxis protein CheY-P-specific phosphatase CheC